MVRGSLMLFIAVVLALYTRFGRAHGLIEHTAWGIVACGNFTKRGVGMAHGT